MTGPAPGIVSHEGKITFKERLLESKNKNKWCIIIIYHLDWGFKAW